MKKIIASILVVMCLLYFEPVGFADTIIQTGRDGIKPISVDLISDKIEHYLSLDYIDDGQYYMSSPIPIYTSKGQVLNTRLVFVFHNTSTIGVLFCDGNNEHNGSSFLPINNSRITSDKIVNEGVTIYSTDNSVEAVINGESISIYGNIFPVDYIAKKDKVQQYALSFSYLSDEEAGKGSIGSIINVPSVQNAVNPHNSAHYLCWAACVASIVRYKTSSYSSLSATQVCYDLASYYPIPPCGYFSSNNIPQAFTIYGVSYTYQSSGLTYNSVKTKIGQSKPVYAGIANASLTSAHAVVVCGYKETTDSHYYYYVMDPNMYPYIEIEITNTSSTSFNYYSGGNTYTTWYHSYY